MNSYLLVLYELDECEGLVETARQIAAADPSAEFVLLTPTTAGPFDLLLVSGSALHVARHRAETARRGLLAAGLNLTAARMGNFDPFRAVEDATRFSSYAAVVVAAPPHPVLHLMRLDLCCRLARQFSNTVFIHAMTRGSESTPLQQSDLRSAEH